MLLMGLDSYAEILDSMEKHDQEVEESLQVLQTRLDSSIRAQKVTLMEKELAFQKEKKQLFLYFGMAFVLGIGIVLLLVGKGNRSF